MKKSNYKGKPNFKTRAKPKDNVKEEKLTEKPNDPSWYVVNGQIAKDVASFSFNTATGAPFTLGKVGSNYTTTLVTPGVMSIFTTPAIGYSMGPDSPVNLAAKNLYSFVRHANSGHANYDSPDLMLYILAMDSVYSWYATMCRLYGIARLYSQRNRYYGSNLITSLGFDPASINEHLADLRFHINQFAVKMSSFVTPVTMSIYRRHVWMYGNIFADGEDPKAQLYAYVPAFLWKYNEYEGAGRLEAFHVASIMGTDRVSPKSNLNWQDILNISATVINPMVYSEDMNIMSGDILKAYGENIWRMDMIPEDYVVHPIYSQEILSQIHNTNFVGAMPYTDGLEIHALDCYQDASVATGGTILYTPLFNRVPLMSYDKVLDMYKMDVQPEDSLVATRNMVHGSYVERTVGGTKQYLFDPHAIGSELCMFFTITSVNVSTGNPEMRVYHSTNLLGNEDKLMDFISKFNQHPILYIQAESANVGQLGYLLGDLNNYTVLDYQDIYDLHASAVMSELALPMMGVTGK